MFSLQTIGGRNVRQENLNPADNGISFRIDRRSRSVRGVEESFELGSPQHCDDTFEIIRPGAEPLGGQHASDFEVTWRLTRRPDLEPTPYSLRVSDMGLFVFWISPISQVCHLQNIMPYLIDVLWAQEIRFIYEQLLDSKQQHLPPNALPPFPIRI